MQIASGLIQRPEDKRDGRYQIPSPPIHWGEIERRADTLGNELD